MHPAADGAAGAFEGAAAVLAETLSRGRSVLVVTGAGVSAESGMPTFRGAANAAHGAAKDDPNRPLWERFSPTDLATPEAFARDTALVSAWYRWRLSIVRDAQPNAGHAAIAELERATVAAGGVFTLATQNVDGLHRRAGSGERGGELLELHGTIESWRTQSGSHRYRGEALNGLLSGAPPYRCSESGEALRPDVVWFGEALPERAIGGAIEAAQACDLFFSVGTSATVYPAAGLVDIATSARAKAIEVNAEATPATGVVDHALRGSSAALMPCLLEAAGIATTR